MSDPAAEPERTRSVKNPPKEARRRAPRPPPQATPEPAPEAAAEENRSGGRRSRSMVCPQCGKYFDITHRPIGSTFDCKCGATLTVPPPKENAVTRPPEVTLKLLELRQRAKLAVITMVVAFAVSIALLSATIVLLVNQRAWVTGTIAGIAGLTFLGVAVVAVTEMRRCKAEIAAEEVDTR